jgi:hypothetical protein
MMRIAMLIQQKGAMPVHTPVPLRGTSQERTANRSGPYLAGFEISRPSWISCVTAFHDRIGRRVDSALATPQSQRFQRCAVKPFASRASKGSQILAGIAWLYRRQFHWRPASGALRAVVLCVEHGVLPNSAPKLSNKQPAAADLKGSDAVTVISRDHTWSIRTRWLARRPPRSHRPRCVELVDPLPLFVCSWVPGVREMSASR